MKRIIALFSLVIFSVSSLYAAQPALDTLNESAAGLSFEAVVPAAQPPLIYRIFELPKSGIAGEQLFTYLHEATQPAKLAPYSYSASRKFMYSEGDNTGCNGKPGIITFYSQICVNGSSDSGNDYPERGDVNGDGVVDSFINAEHIWPQGYFDRKLPMVADLHHLAPTFVTPNGRRSNLKFAEVSSFVYKTSAGSKLGKEGFEPADAVKGNVARALMYFIVRYHDKNIRQGMDYNSFWTKNVPMLMQWNRQDPPDAAERRRNDLVESFQGNRNPFIDDPSLADQVGEMVFRSH